MADDGLVEWMADFYHEQWAGWLRWMLPRLSEENIARWQRQMQTAYADLPEAEKESDRVEARRALALVGAWLNQRDHTTEGRGPSGG
jgi:primosomal protein N'